MNDIKEYTLDKIGAFEKNYSFSRAIEGEGEYRHIHYGDIHTKLPTYIQDATLLPTITEVQKFDTVEYGDILIADASEDYKDLGKAVCYLDKTDNKVISGLHTHRFKPKKGIVKPEYLINLFQTHRYRKFVWKMGTGVSVLGLSKKNIAKYTVTIPSLETQELIAKHFIRLNKIILLQQRKIDLLKQQKKGVMQKIFSQKLRFKDDNGQEFPQWDTVKLDSLFKKSSDRNIKLNFNHNNIISVSSMQFKQDSRESNDQYMKTYNILRLNEIAFEGNKSKHHKYGRFVLNDIGDGIVSHVFIVFKPKFTFNQSFFKEYINNEGVMQKILLYSTTSTLMMTSLNSKEFLRQNISIPSLREQNKIGEFLLKFSKKIELEETKLESLQTQKQALLQQLFK